MENKKQVGRRSEVEKKIEKHRERDKECEMNRRNSKTRFWV